MIIKPAFKSLLLIALGRNPYYSAAKKQQRTVDAAQALTP